MEEPIKDYRIYETTRGDGKVHVFVQYWDGRNWDILWRDMPDTEAECRAWILAKRQERFNNKIVRERIIEV